ncbi:MAG TPA: DarT ssDNA thymidine ADP-ribosyltransferase family protein [Polyangiaceae bacterium]|nr:DarT ssDNA thymidine ADP-ribosyltransferase family protein [Polyangiaceae bacterium]
MNVADIIARKRIQEILHFTTNKGAGGILARGKVLSRERLEEDEYVEHVAENNCPRRLDTDWLDYVNLSITRINSSLFDISQGRWHANTDKWWCVLSFSPEILTHDGVQFVVTNNMYSGANVPGGRGTGAAALERLFAQTVVTYVDYRKQPERYAHRTALHKPNDTTCPQAEVLYPGELPIEYLRKIYVAVPTHEHVINAQLPIHDINHVKVVVDPGVFR